MISPFRPSATASVAIEPGGRIVIAGSVGGDRVNRVHFGSADDAEARAGARFLRTLVSGLLGWPGETVHREFIPVVANSRAMVTAPIRSPDSVRVAAEVLWTNTRAEFLGYEEATRQSTRCSATTTPSGWSGDLGGL